MFSIAVGLLQQRHFESEKTNVVINFEGHPSRKGIERDHKLTIRKDGFLSEVREGGAMLDHQQLLGGCCLVFCGGFFQFNKKRLVLITIVFGEERMVDGIFEGHPPRRLVLQHLFDQIKQLAVLLCVGLDVSLERSKK